MNLDIQPVSFMPVTESTTSAGWRVSCLKIRSTK